MGQGKNQTGYRQLRAWQKADDLALAFITLTRSLPSDYRWLAPQISRAAISVPANIVEGYSRASLREYLHHLSMARGSLAETEYYLHLISRLELLPAHQHQQLGSQLTETAALLYALIRSLSRKLEEEGKTRPYAIKEQPEFLYGEDLPVTPDP